MWLAVLPQANMFLSKNTEQVSANSILDADPIMCAKFHVVYCPAAGKYVSVEKGVPEFCARWSHPGKAGWPKPV